MPTLTLPAEQPSIGLRSATRLSSLDTFRGITIAGMLLVSSPGSKSHIYAPLEHAEWHGWTPTDLIFPFFLFIVGVAMTISFGRPGRRTGELLARAVRRAVILFALGLLLNSYPWWWTDLVRNDFDVRTVDLSNLRILGVLQRIALAFLIATPFVLWSGARGLIGAVTTLLLGYWALMSWVPVPGLGAGVWEPGKDLGAYIDRAVLGPAHLGARTWDALGLLSTIPAVGTVLLGALAGRWIAGIRTPVRTASGLLAAGLAGMAVGLLWDTVFPINKNLWTSSYTVFTAGAALVILGLCYWTVDAKGYRRWARPFEIFGVNAIAVYVLSSLAMLTLDMIKIGPASVSARAEINRILFRSWLGPYNASLTFAIACLLGWLAIMAVLKHKDLRVSV